MDRRFVGVDPVGGGGSGSIEVESWPCAGGKRVDVVGLGRGSKPVVFAEVVVCVGERWFSSYKIHREEEREVISKNLGDLG